MKKLLVTVCGAAMISLATLTQAQESAPRDYNDQNTLEQQSQDQDQRSKNQSQPTQEQPTQNESAQDQGVQDGTNAIQQGQSRESGQPTEDQIDQTMERPNERVPVEGKEGPNGETIFRENGKYFYMNEAGEKKKIKESELRDKTQ
jgi:Ni/Co efflux regulator RcnB